MSERQCIRYLDKYFIPEITDIILDYTKEPFLKAQYSCNWMCWMIKYKNVTIGDFFHTEDMVNDLKELKKFVEKLKNDNHRGRFGAIFDLDDGEHSMWYTPKTSEYVHFITNGNKKCEFMTIITSSEKLEIINVFTNMMIEAKM